MPNDKEWEKLSFVQDAEMYVARPGLKGIWDRFHYVWSGALAKGMLAPCKVTISFLYRSRSNAEVELTNVQLEHRIENIPIGGDFALWRKGTTFFEKDKKDAQR